MHYASFFSLNNRSENIFSASIKRHKVLCLSAYVMNNIILYTFLLSISPFGEAKAGIIYAVFNDIHILVAFAVGLVANLLIYPLFMWVIKSFNHKLWPIRLYRKSVVRLCRMARSAMGNKIEKYGFWGLMVFVMVPIPGTGAYMGTIAASILRLKNKQAFLAISLGVVISCIIMAVGAFLGQKGMGMFQ
jgi:uncharacterized membrane protein